MVRDVEVGAGDVIDGDASGTDQVQGVSMVMGGEVDMLGEVKTL